MWTKSLYKHLNMPRYFKTRFLSTECDKIGINSLGIHKPETIHHNLSYPELFQHELDNGEGIVMNTKYGKTFSVDTGKFTGRSPKDKWVVQNIDIIE